MKDEQTQQGSSSTRMPFEDQHLAHHSKVEQSSAMQLESGKGQVSHCANCDIEFVWSPTIAHGNIYCCTGCAAGGPCNCDYSLYHSVTIMGVIHYE
jgi:late competence protein required for DNA uptake (superfamily II DNA/RNA helicase)